MIVKDDKDNAEEMQRGKERIPRTGPPRTGPPAKDLPHRTPRTELSALPNFDKHGVLGGGRPPQCAINYS